MIVYTQDAQFVLKKWSTWLSMIAASLFAGVQFWDSLPYALTQAMPEWVQGAMALAGLFCALAVPIATSISQKSIPTIKVDPYAISSMYGDSGYSPHNDEEMP